MVKKICIAVKTKDRSPNANYLRGTLFNLERAGVLKSQHLGSLWIVSSTNSYDWVDSQLPSGFRWCVDAGNRNLHQNAARAIHVASRESIAHLSMVIEDDIDMCDEFLESAVAWVEDHPNYPMYALGANYAQINAAVARGGTAWAYPVTAFYGAQALLWQRPVAEQLAKWLGPNPNYNGVTDHGHDLLLQQWGKSLNEKFFLASAPCMVQHVGDESGIGNRFFQFPWGGRDWRYRKVAA